MKCAIVGCDTNSKAGDTKCCNAQVQLNFCCCICSSPECLAAALMVISSWHPNTVCHACMGTMGSARTTNSSNAALILPIWVNCIFATMLQNYPFK